MGKRVTIHDIAREAGVSAATVSYVINNTQGQTISEETKNKIWHVINMLNYKPNVFAKNLRSSTSKLVAVCAQANGYIEKAELVNVLDALSASLRESFALIFCTPPFGRISNADAIIAYNVSKDTFYEIGNRNYIPLIAVNCLVEDKLFFQITPDYEKLRRKADEHFDGDYSYVCFAPSDAALEAEIKSVFRNVVFVNSSAELHDLDIKKVLTTSGLIAEYFATDADLLYEDIYTPLCKQTAECIKMALSHEPFDTHSYKI